VRVPFVGSTAWRVCNVKSMGANGDGKTDDTAVLRKAACDEVVISAPGRYLTGPLNLTSNPVLVISPNATLLGTTNLTAFPVIAPLPSYGACGTRCGSVGTLESVTFAIRRRAGWSRDDNWFDPSRVVNGCASLVPVC
jgi:polygalacturonase